MFQTSEIQSDNFRFFVPVDIQKSKKEGESEKMYIKGVASTKDEDAQGETLDPNGFDLSYFLKSGHLNWNHLAKGNPLAIIGEPTKAEVRDNKLYIEGELYADNELAKGAYSLANILSKNSSTRKLGLSIEGQALERDPLDPRKVTKARITGCALTPSPVNPNTLVDVYKGLDNGLNWKYETQMEDGKMILMSFADDLTKGIIDTEFNIHFSKALEAGSSTGMETANLATTSGASLKEEDVEGKTKKKDKLKIALTKSEVYTHIFKSFSKGSTKISLGDAEQIYNKVTNLFDLMKNEVTSQEDLEKAFAVLGLDSLSKGKESDDDDSDDEELEMAKGLKKAMKSEGKSDEEIEEEMEANDIKKDIIKKAMSEDCDDDDIPVNGKGEEDEEDDDIDEDDDVKKAKAMAYAKKDIKKGLSYEAIESNLLEKGFSEDFSAPILFGLGLEKQVPGTLLKSFDNTELIKSFEGLLSPLSKSMTDVNDLIKGMKDSYETKLEASVTIIKSLKDDLDSTKTEINSMKQDFTAKMNEIAEQPNQPKTILTKGYTDRFNEQAQATASNKPVLSLSNHSQKQQVLALMDSKIDYDSLEKGFSVKGSDNAQWAAAAATLEGTGSLSPVYKSKLEQEYNIVITQ